MKVKNDMKCRHSHKSTHTLQGGSGGADQADLADWPSEPQSEVRL